ncbi:peptidyl-tRNA hydrolase [Periconia macrospinosa]|uniref:peptidyl-tRNA hydrolase n=1 Tax=Periconia macrospinosa TaxID=97972 RepID=A0A2V1DX22_9PLEO|nr:peptidyl-tRNA hydrolase [Periconia macrospinosa]
MPGSNTVSRAHVLDPRPEIMQALAADHHPCRESAQPEHRTADEIIKATTTPISHRERRKQRKNQSIADYTTPPTSDAELQSPETKASRSTANPPKNRLRHAPPRPATADTTTIAAVPRPMSPAKDAAHKIYPLLVCSLGNPGSAYANTLHSAGHNVISHIANVKKYRPFTRGMGGLVSRPDNMGYSFGLIQGFKKDKIVGPPEEDDWTFWQSTSLMNVSGPAVKRAWTEFSRGVKSEGSEPRLVVVHDELEAPLGKVSVKDGGGSPRGHNGLKSVQASMGTTKWWRIGVGIGRPESRDANVVSRYVLRKMDAREMIAIEKACSAVVAVMREISEGKR